MLVFEKYKIFIILFVLFFIGFYNVAFSSANNLFRSFVISIAAILAIFFIFLYDKNKNSDLKLAFFRIFKASVAAGFVFLLIYAADY